MTFVNEKRNATNSLGLESVPCFRFSGKMLLVFGAMFFLSIFSESAVETEFGIQECVAYQPRLRGRVEPKVMTREQKAAHATNTAYARGVAGAHESRLRASKLETGRDKRTNKEAARQCVKNVTAKLATAKQNDPEAKKKHNLAHRDQFKLCSNLYKDAFEKALVARKCKDTRNETSCEREFPTPTKQVGSSAAINEQSAINDESKNKGNSKAAEKAAESEMKEYLAKHPNLSSTMMTIREAETKNCIERFANFVSEAQTKWSDLVRGWLGVQIPDGWLDAKIEDIFPNPLGSLVTIANGLSWAYAFLRKRQGKQVVKQAVKEDQSFCGDLGEDSVAVDSETKQVQQVQDLCKEVKDDENTSTYDEVKGYATMAIDFIKEKLEAFAEKKIDDHVVPLVVKGITAVVTFVLSLFGLFVAAHTFLAYALKKMISYIATVLWTFMKILFYKMFLLDE